MQLREVERERSSLLQFLILLVMIFLGMIAYLAYRRAHGIEIPGLAVLGLLSCLYVMSKERRLKVRHAGLVRELVEKEQEIAHEKEVKNELGLRLKELTGLYRAISAVNAIMDYEQTFDTVLRSALELVDGECGSLMLLDPDKKTLAIASARGLAETVVAETRLRVGEGIAGWVVERGEPVRLTGPVSPVSNDERFRNVIARENEVNVSMVVPLLVGGDPIGVINLGSTPEAAKREFTDYDLRVATIFAQHASVAIQNALLKKCMEENGILIESR